MSGHWTINQGGNARRKLLCPTETRQIDVKVITVRWGPYSLDTPVHL